MDWWGCLVRWPWLWGAQTLGMAIRRRSTQQPVRHQVKVLVGRSSGSLIGSAALMETDSPEYADQTTCSCPRPTCPTFPLQLGVPRAGRAGGTSAALVVCPRVVAAGYKPMKKLDNQFDCDPRRLFTKLDLTARMDRPGEIALVPGALCSSTTGTLRMLGHQLGCTSKVDFCVCQPQRQTHQTPQTADHVDCAQHSV